MLFMQYYSIGLYISLIIAEKRTRCLLRYAFKIAYQLFQNFLTGHVRGFSKESLELHKKFSDAVLKN